MTIERDAATVKASVLAEALPWLNEFHGATIVVKYGGNAMVDERLKASFAADVVFLRLAGLHPVVVHGEVRKSRRCSVNWESNRSFGQVFVSRRQRCSMSHGWSSPAKSSASWSTSSITTGHTPLGYQAKMPRSSKRPSSSRLMTASRSTLGWSEKSPRYGRTSLQTLIADGLIPVVSSIESAPTARSTTSTRTLQLPHCPWA